MGAMGESSLHFTSTHLGQGCTSRDVVEVGVEVLLVLLVPHLLLLHVLLLLVGLLLHILTRPATLLNLPSTGLAIKKTQTNEQFNSWLCENDVTRWWTKINSAKDIRPRNKASE